MLSNQLRITGALLLSFILPSLLLSQPKMVIRPEFDESLKPKHSIYPFKVLKRPQVALVLSGGGARGVAQIGVFKALEQNDIPIDFIAGTSLGSIIGGLYASGYSTAELESLIINTDWDWVLSLSADTDRRNLAIDRKIAEDWSFLVVRFENLEPVIPPAVSTGQRLTDFLNQQTLQALYHPNPSFDDLKIPFRAVATDLISGNLVLLKDGSMAEALRASSTVPLLFHPIEKGEMQLVDGGLVSNLPVEIVRDSGYDVVITVNSTSGLRNADELKAPWQTADQIMGIMMKKQNAEELKKSDVVITPDVGRHSAGVFKGLDTLIANGMKSALEQIPAIKKAIADRAEARRLAQNKGENRKFDHAYVRFEGNGIPPALRARIEQEVANGSVSCESIYRNLEWIVDEGIFSDAFAEIYDDTEPVLIVYNAIPNPRLRSVSVEGNKVISDSLIIDQFRSIVGEVLNQKGCEQALERVLRLYRSRGFSLGRITSTKFEESTGALHLVINEGLISKILVEGGKRTVDAAVLRDFPMKEGDIFEIGKAQRGVAIINSGRLFEYVYLEVAFAGNDLLLTIRLNELPSQLVRLGIRGSDERDIEGKIDIRDENFQGTRGELGLTLSGGRRNASANLEYKFLRLFGSSLKFDISTFYSDVNRYFYGDATNVGSDRWERIRLGEYAETKYGASIVIGSQLEQFGDATVELILQDQRIRNIDQAESFTENDRLALVRFATVIDSKDTEPFPTSGIGMRIMYEISTKWLSSQIGYNALHFTYESYFSIGSRHTFRPKVTFAYADQTMPLSQQFSLGGRKSFFGAREDDRRGRQLLVFNFEYRYHLPFQLIFDSYLRVRYDLGSISSIPQEIKFKTFRHGMGLELALATPIGQTTLGVGRGFTLNKDLPQNPLQFGPTLLYFGIGYDI